MDIRVGYIFSFLLIIILISAFGFIIIKKRWIFFSWLLLIITTLLIERFIHSIPPVFRMLAIITNMFICMKIITTAQNRKSVLIFSQWLTFTFCWAGMRSDIFETMGSPPLPKAKEMILKGLSRITIGIILIILAHTVLTIHLNKQLSIIIISIILLVAFSFILHFGILAISAGILQFVGIKTYYLFNSPLKSKKLSEFWSKRWNVAFSEMTTLTVYRPFKERIGIKVAFFAAFIFSGLLHEMAISLPVNKGFGLPSIYFLIQAMVIFLEEVLFRKNITFFKKGLIAKWWIRFWVIAPAPILFHYSFIKEIIWPMAGLHFP